MESINFIRSCPIMVHMIPAPRERKVHFVDFTEDMSGSEDSSETANEKKSLDKTTERDVKFEILFSTLKRKPLLGILFPNNNIVYHKSKPIKNGAYSKEYNLLFHINQIYMIKKTNCDYCNRTLRKVYRCYDCLPKDGLYKELCKTCHIRRDHVGHNVIMLCYDDSLYDIDYLQPLEEYN